MEKQTKYWLIGLGIGVVALGTLLYIYDRRSGSSSKWYFNDTLGWRKNAHTRQIIETLHPDAVSRFAEFAARVEKELGLTIKATSGFRTWEKQAQLKAQNSQNASAGNSAHNYGFALDVNILDKNGNIILRKASTRKQWLDSGIVALAKSMGFKWGGDFSSYHDPIHFYLEPMERSAMKARYLEGRRDNFGYITLNSSEIKQLQVA